MDTIYAVPHVKDFYVVVTDKREDGSFTRRPPAYFDTKDEAIRAGADLFLKDGKKIADMVEVFEWGVAPAVQVFE